METIVFTLGVILESDGAAKQRIANAYSKARIVAATLPWEGGSARPCVVACIEQIQVHMEAEKSRRDGCSALFSERLSEKDLQDWESLRIIGDKDAALLPSQQRDIH
jgi:hypothetical protein